MTPRRTFAALVAGGCLSLTSTACGPLPGYYEEDRPPKSDRPTPERAEPEGDPAAPIRVIDTGRPGAYYLIDTTRKLCFFQNESALTAVPCASIAEAREVLGEDAAAAEPRQEGPRRAPPVADSPARVDEGDAVEPSPSKPAATAPVAEDKRRFTLAYIAIFCDRRAQRDVAPEVRIKEQGLTVERYGAIEGWMAKDTRAWRVLTQAAVSACTGDEPDEPAQPAEPEPD